MAGSVLFMVDRFALAEAVAQSAPKQAAAAPQSAPCRSPQDLAYSPDRKVIAVADHTARLLQFVNAATGKVGAEACLNGAPGQIAWSADGQRAYTSEYEARTVAEVRTADGCVLRHVPAGPSPRAVAVAAKAGLLLIGDVAPPQLLVRRLDDKATQVAAIPLVREPFWIALTPDESMAVVSNMLPAGGALDPGFSALVSLIDLHSMKCVASIKLPPTATDVRQIAISPDGRWAYVVHTVGRTWLPAVQLDRGWVNTNALSIIDLQHHSHYATALLDSLAEGAADPWGVTLSADGQSLWVSLAGAQQVARIDLVGLHRKLADDDEQHRAGWVNDLSGLYANSLIRRFELPGRGPRGLALSEDGKSLTVAMYYSGNLLSLDTADGAVQRTISLGQTRPPDEARRGEVIFHDGRSCFQHWMSCATCHPNNGRVDGLSWDMPNDGIGNPKSGKSMLLADRAKPATWRGVRKDMDESAAAGFRFLEHAVSPEDLKATEAYIASLKPQVSPYRLANGELTEAAKRGKEIFHGAEAHCAHCHSGEMFTDLMSHDVGTKGPLDQQGEDAFVTPNLVEVWRTAPYLHDGRAATLKDVLTKFNTDDQHGHVSHLSKQQIDDLVAYLLSL